MKLHHVQIESGLADWTFERENGARIDTVRFVDTLIRVGLGNAWEARAEWTPYSITRIRAAGDSVARGAGDVTLGLKKKILDRGSDTRLGPSISLLPSLSIPAGGSRSGAGNWSAALSLPLNYTFKAGWKVQITPQFAAAVDDGKHGHHLQYGSALGLQYGLGDTVTLQASAQAMKDDDPDRRFRAITVLSGASIAVLFGRNLQIDIGANKGLRGHVAEIEPYVGISHHF